MALPSFEEWGSAALAHHAPKLPEELRFAALPFVKAEKQSLFRKSRRALWIHLWIQMYFLFFCLLLVLDFLIVCFGPQEFWKQHAPKQH